jgi:beta-1,4-mannooligosaccharide/beta-1,4-mannosyl-N-acetylglucosamine phosphorylase
MIHLTRRESPVLQASDVPYPASLVFNAGVIKHEGRYVMIFRNDYGSTYEEWAPFREGKVDRPPPFRTALGLAFSEDGVNWKVEPKPCWQVSTEEIYRVYDPRLTVIDGKVYLCFAMDTAHGVRGGIATTEDFSSFKILSLSVPDNRNMVLFPEKIGGDYFRLERPFPVYSRGGDRFDIWSGRSKDLVDWGRHELVLGVEHVPFANDKIGPAAPPIRTSKGWLTTFHAVWRDPVKNFGGWERSWHKAYYGGIMLLDLENPEKVVGIAREPLLAPETEFERIGFRNEVIFPGGMILEDSGEVKIYYGAADATVGLATASVDDLVSACLKGTP